MTPCLDRIGTLLKHSLYLLICQQQEDLASITDEIDDNLHCKKKRGKVDTVPTKLKVKSDPYCSVQHHHHQAPPIIQMGNPISENPCSYSAVEEVLRRILKEVGVPNHRKWAIVVCGGLPYMLATKIIRENEDLQHVLLQPGPGHFEINMTKGG